MTREKAQELHGAEHSGEASGAWPVGQRARAAQILVVDDDPQVARAVARVLRETGLEITIACTADHALELVSCREFDAVITDFMLVETNGLELSRVIREIVPDMPVLLMTGDCNAAVWIGELAEQNFRCMTKPLASQELETTVSDMIRDRRRPSNRPTLRESPASRRISK